MKYLKKHKLLILVTITGIIIVILGFLALKSMFLFDDEKSKYGNRLDGIEEVKIDQDTKTKIETDMLAIEDIKGITVDFQGKIIYVIIKVSNETAVEVSKGYANKLLEFFTDEQKEYYDFQVFLTSDTEESEVYPIAGAKHRTSASFVW